MYRPLPGTGRKIRILDGYPIEVTEDMQRACNEATHSMIMDGRHPGEGFDTKTTDALARLRRLLAAKLPPQGVEDLEYHRVRFIATWLGCWDISTGTAKSSPSIIPVRSIMDIH